MGVATVLPSGPTTARPGPRGGRAFRERGGLPFPGAARRFQRPSQSLNLTAQSVPLTFQCAVLAPQSFGFLLLALDLAAQSVAFSPELLQRRRLGIVFRALAHAPVMPEG
jgi:hypothetical protein